MTDSVQEFGDGENTEFETVFVLTQFDSPEYNYLYKHEHRIVGPPVVLHCAAKDEVSLWLTTDWFYAKVVGHKKCPCRFADNIMQSRNNSLHFLYNSNTASPQLHLKHGFWNSADIYVFTLKFSLGEICCLFVVWGGSNGDGPEMKLDLRKQDAEIALWLRTGWWTGAAPPCCAVCLTDFTQDTVVERYAPTVAAINKTECICQLKTAHTCMTTIQSMNEVYLMTREMVLSYCAVTTGCYLKLVVTFT